ncbi:MAG: InlB B-repeat-containing protein [Acetatifactor sp.]|nr:InlB B-repeat-containing protein [Acetatifactor sp.]
MKKWKKTVSAFLSALLVIGVLTPALTERAYAAEAVRYESEDSVYCDSTHARKIHTGTTNASGGRSATLYSGEYVVYHVSVQEEGLYDIDIHYAGACNPAGASIDYIPLDITVGDGESALHELFYPNYYNTFYDYHFQAELAAGETDITVVNASEDKTLFANVDYIEIKPFVEEEPSDVSGGDDTEPVVDDENSAEDKPVPAAVGRHEAEDAIEFVQGSAGNPYRLEENAGFSGGKAVANMNTWPNNGRAYCVTKVNADIPGTYRMTIAYAGGEKDHPCSIDVNINETGWKSVMAETVTSWNNPTTVETYIELLQGENTIWVTGACNIWYSGMGWEWVNLDYFELEKAEIVPDEPEEGRIKKTAKELQEEGLISFRGRNMNVEDAVTFDYSASGFEFEYDGEGSIRANLTTTANEKFAVDVDGTVTYYSFNRKTDNIYLAKDLSAGHHIIKVYKTQEAMTGLAQLNYLVYDENAKLSPIDHKYNFLIIGASSTAGNQMDPATGAENGYLAFPSVISRAFDATWQQISVSGRGCVQGTLGESGWVFSQDNQLAKLFTYQSWFRDKATMFDTGSYVPDVIITNLNNDFSANALKNGYSKDQVFERMFTFIGELRSLYPDAYIAMTYGNYPNFDDDGIYTNYEIIEGYKAALADYKAQSGDGFIDFVTFPDLVNGQSNHPSEEEHRYLAELVCGKIAERLNVANPMPLTHFEVEKGEIVNGDEAAAFKKITTWASKFSDNGYVEGLNCDLGGSDIAEDGSNVKYISVPVTAPKAGIYSLKLCYGTGGSPDVYSRANEGEWKKASLSSTGSWSTLTRSEIAEVYLAEGDNLVDITGAVNGSYVCLDRIDIDYLREAAPEEIPCGHETTEVVGAREATCVEAGYTGDTVCVDCGEVLAYGSVIEPTGEHSYEAVVTRKATTKEPGEITYICSVCQDTYVEEIPVLTITISFDSKGGSECESISGKVYGEKYGPLPVPTRSGYTFEGWYTSKSGGKKVTESSILQSDETEITLYANWAKNPEKPVSNIYVAVKKVVVTVIKILKWIFG